MAGMEVEMEATVMEMEMNQDVDFITIGLILYTM